MVTSGDEGGQRHEHLAALAAAVEAISPLRARVIAASGTRPAMVRVVNPDASDLAEDITCRPDGTQWAYWWSWDELIRPVADVDATAQAIAQVLRGGDQ